MVLLLARRFVLLYGWRIRELIGLTDKRVYEYKLEVDGGFVYHELGFCLLQFFKFEQY